MRHAEGFRDGIEGFRSGGVERFRGNVERGGGGEEFVSLLARFYDNIVISDYLRTLIGPDGQFRQ